MSESRQTHVTLHDIDPQALDQLVQFAYTAEIVVGEGNVQVSLSHPSCPAPTTYCLSTPLTPSVPCVSGPSPQFFTSCFSVPASGPLPSCPTDSAPSRQPSAAERRP